MSKNYVMPKGKVYFDAFNANDGLTGERYLGDTSAFTISVSSESVQHFSSSGGLKEKDLDVQISIDRAGAITVDEVSKENQALFIAGDLSSLSQSSGSVSDEAINTVTQGRWYQLGVSGSNPTGVRSITDVVITDDTPSAAFTLNDDYTVDLVLGRVFIVEGGAIADTTNLLVTYDKAAVSRTQIKTSTTPVRGALRFIADNPIGENSDVYAPSVALKSSGDAPFIGDELATLGFEIGFNKLDDATAVIYIDGRAVA